MCIINWKNKNNSLKYCFKRLDYAFLSGKQIHLTVVDDVLNKVIDSLHVRPRALALAVAHVIVAESQEPGSSQSIAQWVVVAKMLGKAMADVNQSTGRSEPSRRLPISE